MKSRLQSSVVCILFILVGTGFAIDCFKCVSINGNRKECDDPFHNNYSTTILESPCMGGRKGRDGVFPATACIKISGYYDDTREKITVRGCALDSGTLTTDTELIRMSHCGRFYYDERYVHGCVQSCNDADACNNGYQLVFDRIYLLLAGWPIFRSVASFTTKWTFNS